MTAPVRPEVLDLKMEEVRPFDLIAEGRTVIAMEFECNWVDVTTAVGGYDRVDRFDDGTLIPCYRDSEVTRHSRDEQVRVIRAVPFPSPPLGLPGLRFAVRRPDGSVVDVATTGTPPRSVGLPGAQAGPGAP